MPALPFAAVARLPLPGDNVAIATRRLEKNTEIATEKGAFALDATILEGHRFAIEPIAAGETLLSWRMPFGTAMADIEPGQYVCNDGMLEALAGRSVQMDLPATPNFESEIPPFVLDSESFRPGDPVPVKAVPDTFMGYPRTGGRGSGTRNVVLLLGTSSLTGGFVRALEARLKADVDGLDNLDGIVAVAHTEGAGSGSEQPGAGAANPGRFRRPPQHGRSPRGGPRDGTRQQSGTRSLDGRPGLPGRTCQARVPVPLGNIRRGT